MSQIRKNAPLPPEKKKALVNFPKIGLLYIQSFLHEEEYIFYFLCNRATAALILNNFTVPPKHKNVHLRCFY